MEFIVTKEEEEPLSSVNRGELLLGTKVICFLCLQQTSDIEENSSEPLGIQEVCLRNVCRYLEIDPHSILQKSLSQRLESCQDNLDKWDFVVMMCTECAGVTEKMSRLFRKLEMTTILMNDKVRQFYGILEKSRSSSKKTDSGDRWKEVKELMMGPNKATGVEVKLVENLRRVATTKCFAKVQHIVENSFPKVSLKRVDVKRQRESMPIIQEPLNSPISIPAVEPQPKNSVSERKLLYEVSKQYLQRLPQGNRFRCLKCKKTLFGFCAPNDHLFDHHPETFFAHLKLPCITDEEFSRCAKNALKQTKSLGSVDAKQTKSETGMECPYCKLKCYHNQQLRYHIVMKHHEIIEKKINCLQRKINVPNNKVNVKSKCTFGPVQQVIYNVSKKNSQLITPGNKFRCFVCQKDFSGYNTRNHFVFAHPEKLFTDCNLRTLTQEDFDFCCKRTLATESAKAKYTPSLSGKKMRYHCHLCNQELSQRAYMRYHLMTKHYLHLRERILHLQKNRDVRKFKTKIGTRTVIRTNQTEMSQIVSNIVERSFQTLQPVNKPKCLLCGIVLNNKVGQRAHIIFKHMNKCFYEKKLEMVTDAQFEECCKYVMTEEKNKAKVKEKPGYECQYCKRKCTTTQSQGFRWHLIVHHYSVFEDRVVLYQKQLLAGDLKIAPIMRTKFRQSSSSQEIRTITDKYFETVESGNQKKCLLCATVVKKHHQMCHLFRYHAEKCFVGIKSETLTEQAFRECVSHVVLHLTYQAKRFELDSTKRFGCPFCETKSAHNPNFRYHLLMKHYQELKEEILRVQADWTPVGESVARKRSCSFQSEVHGKSNKDATKQLRLEGNTAQADIKVRDESPPSSSHQFGNPDINLSANASNEEVLNWLNTNTFDKHEDVAMETEESTQVYNFTNTKVESHNTVPGDEDTKH